MARWRMLPVGVIGVVAGVVGDWLLRGVRGYSASDGSGPNEGLAPVGGKREQVIDLVPPAAGGPSEPSIDTADAIDMCSVYATPRQALAEARRLRAAGWVVVEQTTRSLRADGLTRLVASVYHPLTYESPGDVACAAAETEHR